MIVLRKAAISLSGEHGDGEISDATQVSAFDAIMAHLSWCWRAAHDGERCRDVKAREDKQNIARRKAAKKPWYDAKLG